MSENAENKQNEKQISHEKESEEDEELNTLLESLYNFLLIQQQHKLLIWRCFLDSSFVSIESTAEKILVNAFFFTYGFLLIKAAWGYILRYMFAVKNTVRRHNIKAGVTR